MPQRPLHVRLAWTVRDYAKRVWDNSAEDNVLFLAGGIAFNILLAAVPFILLLVVGLAGALNQTAAAAETVVETLIDQLLPTQYDTAATPMRRMLGDIIRARGEIGLYTAIPFIWFSTRLFGSLRSVLAEVFDIEYDRGIIDGKIFDIKITVLATILVVAYTALSAYLAIATTRGVETLVAAGLRHDVMGRVEYWAGRLVALLVITLMFFALYKYLPKRRIRMETALIAAVFASVSLELAKNVFSAIVKSFNPGSLYTGTIAAIVIVIVWTYYAALIFILGGEVAQVYELRRVRKLQRERFEE